MLILVYFKCQFTFLTKEFIFIFQKIVKPTRKSSQPNSGFNLLVFPTLSELHAGQMNFTFLLSI